MLNWHRYGRELARLAEAQTLAKKGSDVARRGGAVLPVQQDIKVGAMCSAPCKFALSALLLLDSLFSTSLRRASQEPKEITT